MKEFTKSRRAIIKGSAALAFSAACAHSGGRYGGWRTARSAHFVVHSDRDADDLRETTDALEDLYAAIRESFFPTTDLEPIEVLLLQDEEDLKRARKQAQEGDTVPVADKRPLVLTFRRVSGGGARERSKFSTLIEQDTARALSLRFIRQNMRRAPLWLRNGLTAYIETVDIAGDVAQFGRRPPRLPTELGRGRVIPLGELLATEEKQMRKGDFPRAHQASAWAFVHWLLNGEEGTLRPRFDKICQGLVVADSPGAEASRAAVEGAFPDVPFADLENRARDYAVTVLGQRASIRSMGRKFVTPSRSYAVVSADPTRVQALLAKTGG